MKRKFLEDLGLEKDAIDKIMNEHGKGVEEAKGDLGQTKTELEQVRNQLQEANATIEGFKDYDQVKAQVEDYKVKYEQSKTDYEAKIADMQFGSTIEAALGAVGAKNTKAVMALLDVESLKSSKDQTADIKAAIEACQKDNAYLFGSNEPINHPVASTRGGGQALADANTITLRTAMGLPPLTANKE